ncbi:DMT family transporter [Actibacterium ureilyticum]|uniref:DMT family transporter n=1 Tax=Actibacterium ureilyticum TaxID=1590614 RepID=UPI000BAB0D07|nr:DMT family transporter [Actibacterium ureilyticum]
MRPDRQMLQAMAWMIGTITAFSAMAVAGRAVQVELDTFELMLYRSLIGLGIVLAAATLLGRFHQISRRHLGTHLLRNISHFTGQNLWFYALTVLPLAQVFALEFTAPLWVTLLAPLFLAERLTPRKLLVVVLGFAGILIVTRPDPGQLSPGLFAAAAAAIGFAGSAIFTKRLTRSESVLCILFWLTLMQATLGLICAGFDGRIGWPTIQTWPWLAVIGAAGLTAHFCLTKALSLAPASVVMPVDFLRLPVISVVGAMVYTESLDLWVLVGGGVILGANLLNLKGK